jgi:EXLDI family protein
MTSTESRIETFHIYRSRTGKFVLHTERSDEYKTIDPEGKPATGWRGFLGLGNYTYAMTAGNRTIEVFATHEELRGRVPEQLYEMIEGSAKSPAIEDLDI